MNKPEEKTLVYLAVPYSHPDAAVRLYRFETVNRMAAKLMREGVHIFSPISHTHPIALAGDLPLGWEYWGAYDRAILNACKKLLILQLEGWSTSKGVTEEMTIAIELGIPVEFIPDNGEDAPSRIADTHAERVRNLASVMSQRIVEIVDPSGRVSYRRPEGHKDVKEARDGIKSGRLGYSIRYADNGENAL